MLQAQHIPHGLRCLFLCRSRNVGISIQRKPCREMSQHSRHGFDIHNATFPNSSTHTALILVGMGGVNVTVSHLQSGKAGFMGRFVTTD